MATLFFNNTHVVPGSNNSRYQLQFTGGGIQFKPGDKIGIQQITIPYSWFNITRAYNNNTFGYKLNGVTYTMILPDGFYTLDDINNSFQGFMYANGHYLVDSGGNIWYPAQLTTNITYYAIQYDAFVITPTLPTGYTNPANVLYNSVTFSNPTTMQLVIPSNNFQSIVGYNAGIYPVNPQSTVYSCTGTLTPNLTPVNSIVIRCSLCRNNFANPQDAFYSFSPNTSFGSNINVMPTYPCWLDCASGSFPSIEIQFTDQNFVPIAMRDNNICVQLLIKRD